MTPRSCGSTRSAPGSARPDHLSLLAEAHAADGNPCRALEVIQEARAIAAGSNGELVDGGIVSTAWRAPTGDAAADSFRRALETARAQGNLALETKAARSLARVARAEPA